MSRQHSNFLKAYMEYATDNFCPPQFHLWTGISVLSGVIGRKLAMRQGAIYHVPNFYVMLVSHPAVGKSTAMNTGTDLIEAVKKQYSPDFRIIPNQVTEPSFLDLMKIVEYYQVAGLPDHLPHSSGYFYASEASSSALQNTCGDFVATLTAFYDCPRFFRKKLKGEKDMTEIENGCMNLLGGATFDYLKTLVNETSVMGGFASRLLYVIAKERSVRKTKFDDGGDRDKWQTPAGQKLISDLAHINRLTGAFKPTEGFKRRVEAFQPKFDQYLIDLNSPRMESLMARKGTHIIKLSMLLSISEGDSLVVTEKHFDEAVDLIESVTKDNPYIISQALMGDKESQEGLNQTIAQFIKKQGGKVKTKSVRAALMRSGNAVESVTATLDFMSKAGWIAFHGADDIELLIEPDAYL